MTISQTPSATVKTPAKGTSWFGFQHCEAVDGGGAVAQADLEQKPQAM
ncbi:hypothetical protein [Amycolatopsis sp. NPDC051371]